MILHNEISDSDLRKKIRRHLISFAGNFNLKIYGKLNCRSGKRMKKGNRLFFHSANEAEQNGFRPCGHCMINEYKKWKNGLI